MGVRRLVNAVRFWCVEQRHAAGAHAGDPDRQYKLARVCETVGKDEEAERWLRLAAGQGHLDAKVSLGLLLDRTSRRSEALIVLAEASEAGSAEAAYWAGTIHEENRDMFAALAWFRVAARGGDPVAAKELRSRGHAV